MARSRSHSTPLANDAKAAEVAGGKGVGIYYLIGRIAAELARKPGERPTVFSGLRAVSGEGLEADDGMRRMQVPWSTIRRITASLGRQTYDMTPILMIDHPVGRSIFPPEVDPLWPAFVAGMIGHLPGALPVDEWWDGLFRDPDAATRIYRRPGLLW